jgi:SRSO17 transposase
VVLGDTAYGSSSEFRQGVRSLGLHYAVAVYPNTTVHLLDEEARFALRRVIAAGVPQREQEPLWLLIEWRDGEPEPANY